MNYTLAGDWFFGVSSGIDYHSKRWGMYPEETIKAIGEKKGRKYL